MKPLGILERLDDAINPIVVKELRQAVNSRLIVAVLLLFLLVQLTFMGIYLLVSGFEGRLEAADFQAGRDVFAVLQGILLATCLLFLPAYTGFRLAAERSDVNVDLLYITTLKPRSIVWGKFAAALVLALMIFSACTPFMSFTYFLRGIDLPSIFFVITLDFLVVAGAVMLAIFLAVVPGNRVFKALLGLLGLGALVLIFGLTLAGTLTLLQVGLGGAFETRPFWVAVASALVGFLAAGGLLYAWSVALISPPSSNRALAPRVLVVAVWLVSGVLMAWFSRLLGHEAPFLTWLVPAVGLLCLCLVIAINEREQWGTRVTRTIPKRWLLRAPAFLFYSGAAGGVLHALVLFALTAGGFVLWRDVFWPDPHPRFFGMGRSGRAVVMSTVVFETLAVAFLYLYCYALTAVLVRRTLLERGQTVYTWVVMVLLVAAGSALPILVVFLLFQRIEFAQHYVWMLTNPVAGLIGVGDYRFHAREFILAFVAAWAGLVTLLNVPWFARQFRTFRPFAGKSSAVPEVPPSARTVAPMDVTRSAT